MLTSDFLIERLEQAGVKHVFNIAGDFIIKFCSRLCNSKKLKLISSTDEAHAGFAADVYARRKGVGCVCVTYNVGALKLCNAVAGAYAERSPMIVISGSPGMNERNNDYLPHHMVNKYETQRDIFKHITCANVILNDAACAGYEIDKAFEALNYWKQPIYIELPRDIAEKPVGYDLYRLGTPPSPKSDLENLGEAVDEVFHYINLASRPVILAGVQIARYSLGEALLKFAEKGNIPIATTMLSKSVISEQHPLFLGVYTGATSKTHVCDIVDKSDCLLILGEQLSDLTVGFKNARFNKRDMVLASVESLKVKSHTYNDVTFIDFCNSLLKKAPAKHELPQLPENKPVEKFMPKENAKITSARFFEYINSILTENLAIVADPGDCLFGAADLTTIHTSSVFIGPAFYNSMGFAIPGALGLQLADPKLRPIVLVGDGSFQMSCSEISTMLNQKLNPIIFVLNNHGYTTERVILEGPFNDIREWAYEAFTTVFGGGVGVKVTTELELEETVKAALTSDKLYLINVCIDSKDMSPTLRKLAQGLARK